jgi:hypothetical protein
VRVRERRRQHQNRAGERQRDRVLAEVERDPVQGLAAHEVGDDVGAREAEEGDGRAGPQHHRDDERRRRRHLALQVAPEDLERDRFAEQRAEREHDDDRAQQRVQRRRGGEHEPRGAEGAEHDHGADVRHHATIGSVDHRRASRRVQVLSWLMSVAATGVAYRVIGGPQVRVEPRARPAYGA